MEQKWYFIIGFLAILFIILISIIFSSNSFLKKFEGNKTLENCNVLKYSSDKSINLVFFGSKDLTQKYMDFFLGFEPFKNNGNAFNFYYIDDYIPDCEIYQGIALLCNSRDLIKKSASCPHDYVVVLKDADSQIRSSNYLNVMSLNLKHPLSVFGHEFGHSFANFAEEYVPADLPSGEKNCVKSCNDFGGKSDGCYQGCSDANYYRSIDQGIMRTLSSNTYGKFDEGLILSRLNKNRGGSLVGNSITGYATNVDCSQQKYLLIFGSYNNGQFSGLTKSVEIGCAGTYNGGDYNYNLILQNGNVISGNFDVALSSDVPDTSGQLSGGNLIPPYFYLQIPYVENAKTFDIKKDNQIIAQLDLADVGGRACKL